MNRTSFLATAALAAVACTSDTGVQAAPGALEFSPALLDLGTTTVGVPAESVFHVDHVGGLGARITSVELLSGDADVFEVVDELPIDVARGARVDVGLRFLAEQGGYFSARVQVTHNGRESPASFDVRAAALAPSLEVSPPVLDFGPVSVGEDRTEVVTLSNRGAADLEITERFFSDGAFTSTAALPLLVPAGRDARLPVTFAPRNGAAVDATLELYSQDTALPGVVLFANDCDDGVPESYDRDEDGFTSCGGDCDDDDDDVRPGASEVPDDVDQDCDGAVDEGTTYADDDGDGYPEVRGDCNDGSAAIHPGVTEIVGNGVDDDCDGVVDLAGVDSDGDGYSEGGGDCDDGDTDIHPGAAELPNDVDDDCDGVKDEGTTARDDDGDGYCERSVNCTDGSTGGDCDDSDPTTAPNVPDLQDGRDNDCDGRIDENTAASDDDADGYSENGGDCDDADPAVNPGNGSC